MSDHDDEDMKDPMMGDDDSDGGMEDYKPPSELPEGVKKEILTAADGANWKKPKAGDEVTVHYVGTLEADGSEFDSSRGRGDPFVFSLGKGQVIKGWDLGVATMKKGEISKFTLAPEFGYGESGSPPKIPKSATLVFEVELISWSSKDDLFSDEGVIKTQIAEGSGYKSPKIGDEVKISLKVVGEKGEAIEDRSNIEYAVGSDDLGPLKKACDKALTGMKKGESAELACTKDYAYPDKGAATITLTLHELYETKDVSFAKDASLMKKQVQEGEGYDTPKDASKVTLSVEAATDGSKPISGFEPKTLEFVAGNGDVCDALECVAGEMKKGEKATLTITKTDLVKETQLGLGGITADKVVLTLSMTEFEKAKDTWSMSEEEKVEFGTARKEAGTKLFKGNRLQMALQRYKKVVELFSYIDNFKDENKEKAKELKKVCELNKAACYIKLQEFGEAKTTCNAVLKDEKMNVKALFRRAQAENGLKNFGECIQDCKTLVDIDSQNRDARALLKQAQAGQKEVDKQAKGLFTNMCKALGKGPIPAPGKTKPIGDDFGDDDDMPPLEPVSAMDAAEEKAAEVASGGA